MNELMNIVDSLITKDSVEEILDHNDFTSEYGLTLTEAEALEISNSRSNSLKENGRVEFGNEVINKMILEFCDSPYISNYNYADTLEKLLDIFYYYKNETMDIISDDELIEFMHTCFDGDSKGSVELLSHHELKQATENLKNGHGFNCKEFDTLEEDFEGDEYGQY